ncbi:MAG: carboxyl transferase domain-containing protein [Candidatus Nanopelagicales bacterium]|nr:carboxyl transferase domain-containing protein [Candidatus Nanopelagicales bacterium]MDZ4249671.1 carboxyl transferase domain-containing protein [Candidatus Nanopelagicales bacterium]
MERISTATMLAVLTDEGSWRSWDETPLDHGFSPEYRAELDAARGATGVDEAVTTGSATINGHAAAIIAGNFDFLAGTVGRSAAVRIIAAFDRACSMGLPVVGLPISGGTRMQEGTPAFLMMAGIAAAVGMHRGAGLPYLVYLRHPTTGGVFATWGSLGDVTYAQPGALIGFLGPRVYEGIYGRKFPADVQVSEALASAGVIDGVASPEEWRGKVADLLHCWSSREGEAAAGGGSGPAATAEAQPDAWASVTATRDPRRPGVNELTAAADRVVTLSGTGAGESAVATVLAVARFAGVGCVVVGQDRSAQIEGRLIGPADLRVALRGIALAVRWRLPLVTIVDTQGGELSAEAELGAMAGEIARCLADMASAEVPTLSLLLGGGAGGAAIALVPADRVLAVPDAWITPLPPEGASVIRYRTPDRAAELAGSQRITVQELMQIGLVDRIVEAPEDGWAAGVAVAVGDELGRLAGRDVDLAARAARWS